MKTQFQILSVSDLVGQVKGLIEGQLGPVLVEGEISNLTRSGSGHWYFSLSDRSSTLSVCLFMRDAITNPLIKQLKNGEKIQCWGSLSVYARRGSFQLIARRLQKMGGGDEAQKLKQLRDQLQREGLFDPQRKRPLPPWPRKIVIITARGGQALKDFVEVYRRRAQNMDLLLVPALVQGDRASASLLRALKKVEALKKDPAFFSIDLVVLTRGGGGAEDLAPFNDEELVRAVADFPLPVISAIGHQGDFVLTDDGADFRAETPTAAAEILSEFQLRSREKLKRCHRALILWERQAFSERERQLSQCHPKKVASLIWQQFLQLQRRLNNRLAPREILHRFFDLTERRLFLDDLAKRLEMFAEKKLEQQETQLEKLYLRLNGLNPKGVLERGYTYLESGKKEIISSKAGLIQKAPGTKIKVHFADGVGEVYTPFKKNRGSS